MLSRSPKAQLRDENARRFQWHEAVLRDGALTSSAIRLAGLIMHRYSAERRFAKISHRSAAKALRMSERTVLRARDLLIAQGWIVRLNPASPHRLDQQPSARYALCDSSASSILLKVISEPMELATTPADAAI